MKDKLIFEVNELLNQALIKLKDVEIPELDHDDYDIGGYTNLIRFKDRWKKGKKDEIQLGALKIVLQALTKNSRETEKMARAYYTSFCNA